MRLGRTLYPFPMILTRFDTNSVTLFAFLFAWLGCVDATLPAAERDSVAASSVDESTRPRRTVDRWIEQLNHPNFATREHAKQRLRAMGLEALDRLQQVHHQAEQPIQVRIAAGRLLGSRLISWSKPTDPVEVRESLNEYGSRTESQRESVIERLAEFPDAAAVPALARLTRYETSAYLSSIAALAVMRQESSESATRRRRHAEMIRETVASSDRPGCQWLRQHARDLESDAFATDDWTDLIARQRRVLDRRTDEDMDANLMLRFVRVLAARAARQGLREPASRIAGENLDLVLPTTRDLLTAAIWAVQHELYSLVLDLKRMHERLFENDPKLMYTAAEALRRTGDRDDAEKLAASALTLNPVPAAKSEREAMSRHDLETLGFQHYSVAQGHLRTRGLFDWAEREFRHVIDRMDVDSDVAAMCRNDAAQMFGDLFEHQKLIDILQPLIERLSTDRKLQQRLIHRRVNLATMKWLSDYHRGLLAIDEGRQADAMVALMRAYRPDDSARIDVLIAMYRLDGGDAWNRRVKNLVAQKTAEFERDIFDASRNKLGRVEIPGDLTGALNQYAWLVSNTEGDYEEALRRSEKSLQLAGDSPTSQAPLLDTLARCHFALGNLPEAIETQQKAVDLMPHFPPLRRQLTEFLEARREQDIAK